MTYSEDIVDNYLLVFVFLLCVELYRHPKDCGIQKRAQ